MIPMRKKIKELIAECEKEETATNATSGIVLPDELRQHVNAMNEKNIELLKSILGNIESERDYITDQALETLTSSGLDELVNEIKDYVNGVVDKSNAHKLDPKNWAGAWLMVVGLGTVLEENDSK